MSVKELIRVEENGTLSFGDYELPEKTKKSDFEYQGDLYKVKTYRDLTRLEKNGSLVYESEPGTAVTNFLAEEDGVSFDVDAQEDVQIILGMAEDEVYRVYVDDENTGVMKTSTGGKLVLSIEKGGLSRIPVKVVKL